jgi:kinesin family protein 13
MLQGEVAGRLQVELRRIAGQFPQDHICESVSETSTDSGNIDDEPATDNQVTVRVSRTGRENIVVF